MDPLTAKPAAVDDLQARLSNIERLLASDPAQAEAQASALLTAAPGHQMGLLLLGIARRLMGNSAAAMEILTPLSHSCADAPLVHLQLGLALREAGRHQQAVQSLRRAVAVKADFSDAWLALADLLTAMGDSDDAAEAFMLYVRYSKRDPRLQQVAAALRDNHIAEAEAMLRGDLEQHPMDIAAMCMLADVAERHDQLSEAEALLKQCLDLAPGFRRARHNYAVVLLRENRTSEALQETGRLLADEPANPEVRKLRSAILVRLREYEEAITICEALLDEHPDQPAVWASLGHLLKTVGRREDCINAYHRAIELAPQFGEAYWSLANLKTWRFADAQLEAMRTQLAMPGLADSDRLHFHFAIGKALEDRAEFADSFRHYDQGNRLRRKHKPFDMDEFASHVRRSIALFTPGFFAERAAQGLETDDPIFVVGLPRSGSTLVEQILASHSAVEGTMELTNIVAMASSLNVWETGTDAEKYPEVLAHMEPGTLRDLGQSYIDHTRVQRKLGRPFFIDKMPNNFAHVGLIQLILPNAHIIDVRRHPLACGFSLFKEHFAGGQNFSYSLEDIGRYYQYYVELMAHFDAVLPGRVHRVFYESLVEDTEAEVRRLLEYCGLPFEAGCLEFHRTARAISTASSEQVRSPIFRTAIDHWRHYDSWLGPLRDTLGDLLTTYPQVPTILGAGEGPDCILNRPP